MSMSDHIQQQVLQEFFAKKVSFSWKMAKQDPLVYQSRRTSTHIENILPNWSWGSVAHCFNPLHNVRYRTTERTTPNRWQRFESSCNQSVFHIFFLNQFFIFFSLLGPHVLVFFSHLLIFFILCGSLHFILLIWNSSHVFALIYLLKMKHK